MVLSPSACRTGTVRVEIVPQFPGFADLRRRRVCSTSQKKRDKRAQWCLILRGAEELNNCCVEYPVSGFKAQISDRDLFSRSGSSITPGRRRAKQTMRCFVFFVFVSVSILLVNCSLHSSSSESTFVVPSIVHQTYDYQAPSFFLYLSIICAQHFIKPTKHLLWVNDEGRYRKSHWEGWQNRAKDGSWEADLAKLIKTGVVEVKTLTYPLHPPGNDNVSAQNHAHRSDFVRMQVLMQMGGIYLDTDAFALASLNELRTHAFVMSFDNIINPIKDSPKRLNNGVVLSAANASFLRLWQRTYATFDPSSWDQHSSIVPFTLAMQYPDLIHVEMNRISPISFGFQTAEAAAAITCGIYMPKVRAIWYPRYDEASKRFTFENTTPDTLLFEAFDKKLVLHLTMSQVRGLCMMRKNLSGPEDLVKLPSWLGHVFRLALFHGVDDFDYASLAQADAKAATSASAPPVVGSGGGGSGESTTGGHSHKDKAWSECRTMLGMHTPFETSDQTVPSNRQQYLRKGEPPN